MRLFTRQAQTPAKAAVHRRWGSRPNLEVLERRDLLAILVVSPFSPGASDAFGNGSPGAPFQSIQRALNVANNGDDIRLASGTQTYNASQDVLPGSSFSLIANLGDTAVAVVYNKFVSITGGFNPNGPGGWTTPDLTNPTVIDAGFGAVFGPTGQFVGIRGIWVTANQNGGAGLALNNVKVTHGLGTPIPLRGGISQFEGFGAGLFSENSYLSVSNSTFASNLLYGYPNLAGAGGDAAGAGIGIVTAPGPFIPGFGAFAGPVVLNNDTLLSNAAIGNFGATKGGIGQGGGLFALNASLQGNGLTFQGNVAVGGASGFSGDAANLVGLTGVVGDTGAGQGGAMSVVNVGGVSFSNAVFRNNQAVGGAGPGTEGGSAKGGAINLEGTATAPGALTLTDSVISGNMAVGGTGAVVTGQGLGGAATGGGLDAINFGTTTLNRVIVQQNVAQGGVNVSGSLKPTVTGGGIGLINGLYSTAPSFNATNLLLVGNVAKFGQGNSEAVGGGGGGLSDAGYAANITHATIADNQLGNVASNLQGQGLLIYAGGSAPSSLNLAFSIIANQINSQTPLAAALAVLGATSNLNTDLFANNSVNITGNSNQNNVLTASSAGFINAGSPNFNYGLQNSSPAVNAANGSNVNVDVYNNSRNGIPDIGAVELGSTATVPQGSTSKSALVDAVFSGGF